MIRLLPFILIPVIIIAGLGYWRYLAGKQNLIVPQQVQAPIEVPKTLPAAASPKDTPATTVPQAASNLNPLDPRMQAVETAVADLKARVSALEKTTPAPVVSQISKYPLYIPLGSGGQNGDKNWISVSSYGATIDPAEYPGYTSMQLEVNFRLTQKSGTAYARLYNVTDSSYKEQVSTTLDDFSWQTSAGFTLPAGKKTYTLQMKSTEGVDVQLQSARIKVNF